jgi:hypothetical protein
MKKNFSLTNVVLYAKGWYTRTEDPIKDLIKILELDDYTPFSKEDVVRILMSEYEKSFDIKLIDFINSIHKNNCWKVGFYTNECEWIKDFKSLPHWDLYTAVLYKILSDLRFLDKSRWNPKFPKYSKENPRPQDIKICTLYEHFAKRA